MLAIAHYKTGKKALKGLSAAVAVRMEETKGPFRLAISGGDTARKLFKLWTKSWRDKIDWKRVRFYWVDERCVGPSDEASNYGHAREELLEPLKISPRNIRRIRGEANPKKEAVRYAAVLKKELPKQNGLPRFDCVILGIGEDGHTASIFPANAATLLQARALCAVSKQPETEQTRVTLTGPVIVNAASILVAAVGKSKRKIVGEIFSGARCDDTLPAGWILSRASDAAVFTDV